MPISLAHPDGSLTKDDKKRPDASPRKGRHLQIKNTYFATSYSISNCAMALIQMVKSSGLLHLASCRRNTKILLQVRYDRTSVHEWTKFSTSIVLSQPREESAAGEENQAPLKQIFTIDPRLSQSNGKNSSQTRRVKKTWLSFSVRPLVSTYQYVLVLCRRSSWLAGSKMGRK